MKRRKIWVGLGTAVLVTSQVAAHEQTPLPIPGDGVAPAGRHAAAAHRHGAAIVLAAKAKAGGEGGEGGEGNEGGEGAKASYDAGLKPAVRFYRNIELIRGHLLVGDELVREKRWAEALPHFLHPSAEIYGKIRGDLKTYEVPPFLAALKALAQTVKAKNEGAYRTALRRRRQWRQGKRGRLATVRRRHRPRDAALGDGRVLGGDRQWANREARRVPGLPRLRLAS